MIKVNQNEHEQWITAEKFHQKCDRRNLTKCFKVFEALQKVIQVHEIFDILTPTL